MKYAHLVGVAVCGLVLCSGCGPKPTPPGDVIHDGHDHDGHEHATSFDGAVKELAGMRDTIRDGFAADDESQYHGALHEVGHVLENLESMAGELEDDAKEQATAAIDKLFQTFGDVDAKLHGQEGVDYQDVSEEIDSSIAVLQQLVGGAADPAAKGSEGADEGAKDGDEPAAKGEPTVTDEAPPEPPADSATESPKETNEPSDEANPAP